MYHRFNSLLSKYDTSSQFLTNIGATSTTLSCLLGSTKISAIISTPALPRNLYPHNKEDNDEMYRTRIYYVIAICIVYYNKQYHSRASKQQIRLVFNSIIIFKPLSSPITKKIEKCIVITRVHSRHPKESIMCHFVPLDMQGFICHLPYPKGQLQNLIVSG